MIGALSFPLQPLAMWVLFSEDSETLAGLLRFWWRVPGELLIGAVPAVASGAAFGAILAGRGREASAREAGGKA